MSDRMAKVLHYKRRYTSRCPFLESLTDVCKYPNLQELRICEFDTESVSVTQANMYHRLIYVPTQITAPTSLQPPNAAGQWGGGYSHSLWETTPVQEKGGGDVSSSLWQQT